MTGVETSDIASFEESLQTTVFEANDHPVSVTRNVSRVNAGFSTLISNVLPRGSTGTEAGRFNRNCTPGHGRAQRPDPTRDVQVMAEGKGFESHILPIRPHNAE